MVETDFYVFIYLEIYKETVFIVDQLCHGQDQIYLIRSELV